MLGTKVEMGARSSRDGGRKVGREVRMGVTNTVVLGMAAGTIGPGNNGASERSHHIRLMG